MVQLSEDNRLTLVKLPLRIVNQQHRCLNAADRELDFVHWHEHLERLCFVDSLGEDTEKSRLYAVLSQQGPAALL